MSWGEDWNGGPHHAGRCPECDQFSGTCYDELCEDCAANAPRKCPDCGDMVNPDFMTEHGCCTLCLDERAENFTTKINERIDMVAMANELFENIHTITKTYRR